MPRYDYRCEKCGIFEKEQRITEPALEKCPQCNGPVKRIISKNVGILYKTDGFYTTDYRSSEYKEKQKSESNKADKAS
ncbi:MAG: hypothetical protein PWQ96_828 [Clostridia bacterium]|nr:hypothetical protein [Clostridiales bacterium]MDK2985186.1 hypothetical protein [Clostridia bacterium]